VSDARPPSRRVGGTLLLVAVLGMLVGAAAVSPAFPSRASSGATPLGRSVAATATTYSVRFTESGLPPGTEWSVTLGASVGTSSTKSIVFSEPNGTYGFTVAPLPGYKPSATAGAITVNGANVARSLTFTATGTSSGNGLFGLPVEDGYLLLAGAAVAAVAAAVLLLRRRREPAEPDEPEESPAPVAGRR
jgi:hypothetical protein